MADGPRDRQANASVAHEAFNAFKFRRLSVVWLFNTKAAQLRLSLQQTPQLNGGNQ